MTRQDLIDLLSTYGSTEDEVFIAVDAEGNEFRHIDDVDFGEVEPYNENRAVEGIILWPI